MRILFTIAHFFNAGAATGGASPAHGSLAKDPRPRLQALTACVNALHHLFADQQRIIDISRKAARPANVGSTATVDVVICTTHGQHLLADLRVPNDFCQHLATNAEPPLLGFECQAVLRDQLGRYDYYCYLEDDLILHDPWFFRKLAWFNRLAGDQRLLQPNRFEIGGHPSIRRVYIDGDLRAAVTARYQDMAQRDRLEGRVLDEPIAFERALNPHSGCYFLNAPQMAHWAQQPHFLDRDTSFIGPLESAATLGILRTFAIYKTTPEYASFLEIQHSGTAFLGLIRPGGTVSPDWPAETPRPAAG